MRLLTPSPERTEMTIKRLTAAALATVGTLAGASAMAIPADAAKHHRRHHHHHSAIPQHNGGDRDADNNGGPSDGDGNV
jgi:hypothetical protein